LLNVVDDEKDAADDVTAPLYTTETEPPFPVAMQFANDVDDTATPLSDFATFINSAIAPPFSVAVQFENCEL